MNIFTTDIRRILQITCLWLLVLICIEIRLRIICISVVYDGMAQSDGNTDIMCVGGGNTSLFANDHWEVSYNKVLQGYYGNVRICNYFLEKATSGYEAGTIKGSDELIKNYIGEGSVIVI